MQQVEKPVRITLYGTLVEDKILLRINDPRCSKQDHFELILVDHDGNRRDLGLDIHSGQFKEL